MIVCRSRTKVEQLLSYSVFPTVWTVEGHMPHVFSGSVWWIGYPREVSLVGQHTDVKIN